MFKASTTSSVPNRSPIAHPTTRRFHASSTVAKYNQPSPVVTYVMSATQS